MVLLYFMHKKLTNAFFLKYMWQLFRCDRRGGKGEIGLLLGNSVTWYICHQEHRISWHRKWQKCIDLSGNKFPWTVPPNQDTKCSLHLTRIPASDICALLAVIYIEHHLIPNIHLIPESQPHLCSIWINTHTFCMWKSLETQALILKLKKNGLEHDECQIQTIVLKPLRLLEKEN